MALIECPDCKKQVSDAAPACPNCGRPIAGASSAAPQSPQPQQQPEQKKEKKESGCVYSGLAILAVLGLIGFIAALATSEPGGSSGGSGSSSAKAEKTEAECRTDLRCWAEKHKISATVRCQEPVERLAKYSHKWTDGFLESKFSHFRWSNKSEGHITFIGDQIQFQNGFGAWQNYTYQCDYDPDGDEILDVRASPGRLE